MSNGNSKALTSAQEEQAVERTRDTLNQLPTMQDKFSAASLALALWTTLPTDTDEGKADIIRHMTGDESDTANDRIGKSFDVEHIIAHSVQGVDENGEEWTGDRIVLIGPDGDSVAFVSAGVRRSLQLIMGLYGVPPWKPARRFELRQIQTKRGRRTFTLVPVTVATVAKPKAK